MVGRVIRSRRGLRVLLLLFSALYFTGAGVAFVRVSRLEFYPLLALCPSAFNIPRVGFCAAVPFLSLTKFIPSVASRK